MKFNESVTMKFNENGPVFGPNGLLELDTTNQNCPIGFNEVRYRQGPGNLEEVFSVLAAGPTVILVVNSTLSFINTLEVGNWQTNCFQNIHFSTFYIIYFCLALDLVFDSFLVLELSIRRPSFYSCGNNCPGGR